MSAINRANPPAIVSLTADAYRQLEHAASLKGLLKPFKGKGSWSTWRRWPGQSRRSYNS